jgi:glyoxylase-like metal-dependent hydrolase (beta-lactamase superfamily II)
MLNTHAHPDHCSGNSEIYDFCKVPLLTSAKESTRLVSMINARYVPSGDYTHILVNDKYTISVGNISLSVLETPGTLMVHWQNFLNFSP